MKKFLVVSSIFLGCLLTANVSNAQSCSADDKSALRTCTSESVETCRDAATSCNPYTPVLTLDDVRTIAIDVCCSKRTKTARNLCLVKEKTKYVAALAKGSQAAFFKAARAEVDDVRKNVCKDSTYENLF